MNYNGAFFKLLNLFIIIEYINKKNLQNQIDIFKKNSYFIKINIAIIRYVINKLLNEVTTNYQPFAKIINRIVTH